MCWSLLLHFHFVFLSLCAHFPLSLLEGGANGIDDTAAHFAEVRAALRNWSGVAAVKRSLSKRVFNSPPLPGPPPAAVAPTAAGAAVYGGQHTRLGTPAPWRSAGRLRRPGRSGGPWRGSDRRLGAGRYRGLHGGFAGLYGTLGSGAPPSPEEVPVQRQQQAGPLAGGGGVSDPPPPELLLSTSATAPLLTAFSIWSASLRIVQQFLTGLFSNSGVPGSPPLSW